MAHVTFIHGIGNKPQSDELLKRWKSALSKAEIPFNLDAEATSKMVYWADVLHAKPLSEDEFESALDDEKPDGIDYQDTLVPSARSLDEEVWISSISRKLGMDIGTVDEDIDINESGDDCEKTIVEDLERIPLPGFVKDAFLKRFLKDVHHYLFNIEYSPRTGEKYNVQDEIRSRFTDALKVGETKSGPHIVVSHSMGTVIAYDCLMRAIDCPKIDALITIGSPLGIDEVQDKLKPEWTRDSGFPSKTLNSTWQNFYDPLDIVSRLDPKISNDFKNQGVKVISDISQKNEGIWRHDIEKYLMGEAVSLAISQLVGT